ncbi:ubiquinone biosynthesis accessory factor UbiJ [Rickettsiella grylli]|uniref:ubiquinone biosynthesis accessory factor UbiJ n=1 Tax=Rickettsiella grylli TaxID=59196 RepID=UPI001F12192D|nr:SCP2 sterol-binding domain-containing protein [Rickettsiella grylli]
MSNNNLLSIQEAFLNCYLNLDPESKEQLRQLSGKVIKIEWGPLTYYWQFKSDSISLSKIYNGPADLVLRGSTFDFLRLIFSKNKALIDIPLQVSGDMAFGMQFRAFFLNLEMDWEEQLAKILGDTAAYPVIQLLKAIRRWARESVKNLSENLTNYLQTEIKGLISTEELQVFFSDIDELRDDCARLEARIQRLEKKGA